MGLDMFLNARRSFTGYDFQDKDSRENYERVANVCAFPANILNKSAPYIYVEGCVAYWRKVNAIHSWFVKNCANGVDNCQPISITRNQLQELLDICKCLMEDKDVEKAMMLLPTQSGFFFGDTDYDEWYWEGIASTVEQLTRVLTSIEIADKGDKSVYWEFIYCASW